MEKTLFRLEKYELKLHRNAYLVHVQNCNTAAATAAGCNGVLDLPEWVFQSEKTIWLLDDSKGTLYERSLKGELIKNELSKIFRKSVKSSRLDSVSRRKLK